MESQLKMSLYKTAILVKSFREYQEKECVSVTYSHNDGDLPVFKISKGGKPSRYIFASYLTNFVL